MNKEEELKHLQLFMTISMEWKGYTPIRRKEQASLDTGGLEETSSPFDIMEGKP